MKTQYFVTSRGTKVAYFSQLAPKAKDAIIIVHGLAEHKGRYEDFIHRLSEAGISVFALDLCGHGESSGLRGDIIDFDIYINDLHSFIQFIKEQNPSLRISLFGHSIGGLIATTYAEQYKSIDRLILSSPSFETPKNVGLLRFIPLKLLSKIYIKKRHSESKEMLEYSRKDPLSCRYISLRLVKNIFLTGVKHAIKNLQEITIPILVLGGKLDPLVNSENLKSTFNKFGSSDKTLIIYENAKHRIVQNEVKDESISQIISWIKTRNL